MSDTEVHTFLADLIADDDGGARLAFWLYDGVPYGLRPAVWLAVGRQR